MKTQSDSEDEWIKSLKNAENMHLFEKEPIVHRPRVIFNDNYMLNDSFMRRIDVSKGILESFEERLKVNRRQSEVFDCARVADYALQGAHRGHSSRWIQWWTLRIVSLEEIDTVNPWRDVVINGMIDGDQRFA